MRRRLPLVTGLAVASLLFGVRVAAAQSLVEIRAADTEYRYADWSYTWAPGVVADVFYVGVPGSNELNVGGGFALKRGPLTVTPLVYAVAGKENDQRGIKVALLVSFEKDGWKVSSFLGRYTPVSGTVTAYTVLDTLDVTRSFGPRWETGLQAGFFQTGDTWNPQIGPVLKINDKYGAWAVSYRFGPSNELRAGRMLAF